MATIDELIVKMGFSVDERGLRRLEAVENVTAKVGPNARKMGEGFASAGKDVKQTAKATDLLAASFGRIALAAVSALSAGMAMRFALNAADEAKGMRDLAGGLGMNSEELSLWGRAMRSAGRDAKTFYGDLRKLRDTFGSYSLDEVLADADFLKDIHDREGEPAAIIQAQAMGYGEDSARWLMQGSEGVNARLEESRRLGQDISRELIDQQTELSESYSKFAETLDATFTRVAGKMSGGMSRVLHEITEGLAANKGEIDRWADGAANAFDRFLDGLYGTMGESKNATRANGQTPAENASSSDPLVRQEEIGQRRKDAWWGSLGSVYFHGSRLINPFIDQGDTLSQMEGELNRVWAFAREAERNDRRLTIGDDAFEIEELTKRIQRERAEEIRQNDPMYAFSVTGGGVSLEDYVYEEARSEAERRLAARGISSPPGQLSLGEGTPADMTSNLNDLHGHLVRHSLPPSQQYATPQQDAGYAPGSNGGGVVIENQNVEITIEGTGLDGDHIARMSAAEIRAAARNADYAPRRR